MGAARAALLLLALAAAAPAAFASRGRVLVLTDTPGAWRARFGGLAAALDAWGFSVDARAADDPSLRLREWDEWRYDKLVLIPGSKGGERWRRWLWGRDGARAADPARPAAAAAPARTRRDAAWMLSIDRVARRGQRVAAGRPSPAPRFPPTPRPPPADLGGALSSTAVVEFVESGRDALLALSADATEDVKALADFFSVDVVGPAVAPTACAGGDAFRLLVPVTGPAPIVGGAAGGRVVFEGVALTLPPRAKQAWAALPAPPSASTTTPGAPGGPALALVAAVQTTANARLLVSGSEALLADASTAPVLGAGGRVAAPANAALARSLLAWAFNEAGSLDASPIRHRLATPGPGGARRRGGDAPYRVGDEVTVEIDVWEAVPGGGRRPFRGGDVQVEYTMLDPHVRLFLAPANATSSPTLAATLKAPDVYGVFKFVVRHARPGLSFVDREAVAPLRPFAHDEFDRFLPAALPYYTAAGAVSVAFFGACLAALYSE
jgi:oligosaccharyltransferase complex subunit beta